MDKEDGNRSSMVLCGKDLRRIRTRKQMKRGRPHKNSNITDAEVLNQLRSHYRKIQREYVNNPIVGTSQSFTKGTIVSPLKLVKLEKSTMKVLPHMGVRKFGGKCLYPEETLFLMFKGAIMVYLEDTSLSIQAAMSFLINDDYDFKRCIIYDKLSKFGIRLHRINEPDDVNLESSNAIDKITDSEGESIIVEMSASKRTWSKCAENIDERKEYKKTKLSEPFSVLSNDITELPDLTSLFNKEKINVACLLDFDITLDYLKCSTETIIKKFIVNCTIQQDKTDRFSLFNKFPCLVTNSQGIFQVPDFSLIGDDWDLSESEEYVVRKKDRRYISYKKNSECLIENEEIESSNQTQINIKYPYIGNSFQFPSSLNKSIVKISHSWKEYKSAAKYLCDEKLNNSRSSNILWIGKTKPLISKYVSRGKIMSKLNYNDESYLENFVRPSPCYDMYSRQQRYKVSDRPAPVAKLFIPEELLFSYRELIGSASEDNKSVIGCLVRNLVRFISLFKLQTSNK